MCGWDLLVILTYLSLVRSHLKTPTISWDRLDTNSTTLGIGPPPLVHQSTDLVWIPTSRFLKSSTLPPRKTCLEGYVKIGLMEKVELTCSLSYAEIEDVTPIFLIADLKWVFSKWLKSCIKHCHRKNIKLEPVSVLILFKHSTGQQASGEWWDFPGWLS